ncbi:MAG TPA: glycoside hydrolase family 38 C-terminal domain-containing protein [Pyrinomonadaceae bacterium]|jgi:alpha-mannosidase|nr:glycoside hydrolase family 38 C-terminal domain-containing protein [Pyrinomonadaceae bacterium]
MPLVYRRFLSLLSVCALALSTLGQAAPDLTKEPTLYVVGYAHLDTQWRWEYPQVINEFLPRTMRDNFKLFEKYPSYTFNFSGSNRYRMMKEYWPDDYARVKRYVAAGRWFPAGSSVEEGDPLAPSAESIVRQILYGSNYFKREFGRTSAEYMLPDSFGFPASFPSILAHMGLKGFSTQKLYWGSGAAVGGPDSPHKTPRGIPFNVGLWEGPDGRTIISALNPRPYDSNVREDYSKSPPPSASNPAVNYFPQDWPARTRRNGEAGGLFADYTYFGAVGDIGGAPYEFSVKMLDAVVNKKKTVIPPPPPAIPPPDAPGTPVQVGDGPVRVLSATAEQMFLDIRPEQAARLPRYKGEFLLTNHSAGSINSQTYQKRWNRHNELLADAAERASVGAAWLGARRYPLERLNNAWTLVMGGQFHDILPGTATPKAFEFSWNDDVIAMNQFAGVLESATEGLASGLDTRGRGTPVVVYNPLNVARADVVEANLSFPGDAPAAVRVADPRGREVPAQVVGRSSGALKILFLATVPPVGYAVYDVQPSAAPSSTSSLKVSESSLENDRYRIGIDGNGDVSGIFDKTLGKELLAAPARLAFQTETPDEWPAWNMDWADRQQQPRAYVSGPARVRVVERGAARVGLEIERESEGSKFVQTIRLAAGAAGDRVEFHNRVEWRTPAAALKATFPLTASNPNATYNWDVGTIERGNNDEKKFEVPSHQWFDLTDRGGGYGVTVLSDCKYGSDKPDDRTLRLTLLYTPGLGKGGGWEFHDQTTQDWGRHEFTYGLASHAGDWRQGRTDWIAQRLNQPLIAFQTARHAGALGKTLSLLDTGDSRVRVLAFKKAEEGDDIILRMVELDGRPARGVRVKFASPVASAREVNGREEPIGPAAVSRGELVTDFGPYQLRTFTLKLAPPRVRLAAPRSLPVELTFDLAAAGPHASGQTGAFDADGRSLPAEMLPPEILYAGVRFRLAAGAARNALVPRGQTIKLPGGAFRRLYVLAASSDGDRRATFRAGDEVFELNVQHWGGFVGQWDNRRWVAKEWQPPAGAHPETAARLRGRVDPYAEMAGLTPGFVKRAPLGWYASHHHRADGTSEPYAYSYLFAYAVPLPPGAATLTLPDDDKLRILAVTVSDEGAATTPARPLYDTLER